MYSVLTQNLPFNPGQTNLDPTIAGQPSPTPLVITGPLDPKIDSIGAVVGKVISFLYPIAAILLLLYLIWSGFSFIFARGDAEKVKNAKARITAAVIGFLLLISAYFVTRLFSMIFGLDSSMFE